MRWIVSAYYTPDYQPLADKLRRNLDFMGVDHAFIAMPPRGNWATNTRAKPSMMRQAMIDNPGDVILFLDVDCSVRGSIDRIERMVDIRGDVGFFVRTRLRSNGKPAFLPRSGTAVLRPTEATELFLDAWVKASDSAHKHANDQDTLVVALGKVPELTVTMLPNAACAVAADGVADPIILHDRGPKGAASRIGRFISALTHGRTA